MIIRGLCGIMAVIAVCSCCGCIGKYEAAWDISENGITQKNASDDDAAPGNTTVSNVWDDSAKCREIVRLHVVAESDSQEDQALKLQVRDAVMNVIIPQISECRDWNEVFCALEKCREAVLAAAEEAAAGDVRVETGVFAFDRRTYMGTDIPAGDYRAMRVVIGSGSGRNWWGIMFPGALPIDTGDDTVYYSAVVEWIFALFGREIR